MRPLLLLAAFTFALCALMFVTGCGSAPPEAPRQPSTDILEAVQFVKDNGAKLVDVAAITEDVIAGRKLDAISKLAYLLRQLEAEGVVVPPEIDALCRRCLGEVIAGIVQSVTLPQETAP